MPVSDRKAKAAAVPIAFPLVSSRSSPERMRMIRRRAAPQSRRIRARTNSLVWSAPASTV
jgi:hypothetical protein